MTIVTGCATRPPKARPHAYIEHLVVVRRRGRRPTTAARRDGGSVRGSAHRSDTRSRRSSSDDVQPGSGAACNPSSAAAIGSTISWRTPTQSLPTETTRATCSTACSAKATRGRTRGHRQGDGQHSRSSHAQAAGLQAQLGGADQARSTSTSTPSARSSAACRWRTRTTAARYPRGADRRAERSRRAFHVDVRFVRSRSRRISRASSRSRWTAKRACAPTTT